MGKAYLLIALMTEAARTSETLVHFYQTTWRYNPEDSHLRTHRRENLKSYWGKLLWDGILVLVLGRLHATTETKENHDGDGRSQDLPDAY
jgi:hypothetical protein